MATASTAKLSPIKWFLGVLVFFVVTIGCAALGVWTSGGTDDDAAAIGAAPAPIMAVALIVFGVVVVACGLALYALILLTNLFTFDFTKPFFKTFGGKLWVAHLIVGLLVQTGFARDSTHCRSSRAQW